MNFWKVTGDPNKMHAWGVSMECIHNIPVDPKLYCIRPHVHPWGVKPAGVLSVDGVIYLSAELHNWGEDLNFRRQQYISSWIITSRDYGKTWDLDATPQDFFTGRLASPHFIQFGQDYQGARDEYVYASFPAAEDGGEANSPCYWDNGDFILLGRVPKDQILNRAAWEFFNGADERNEPSWSKDGAQAKPIFYYHHMTGENHIVYNAGLKRYLMGNTSFIDPQGNPRPYHHDWPESTRRSQLTLYEAPEPWGPWSIFFRDDNFGRLGIYQPNFPAKWMSADGKTLWMVYSGSYEDYNFTIQKMTLETEG